MDFGEALRALRQGYAVRRAGWTVTLGIVKHPPLEPDGRLSILYPDGSYTPFGKLDADLLALDWEIAGPLFQEEDVMPARLPLQVCPGCLRPAGKMIMIRLEAA